MLTENLVDKSSISYKLQELVWKVAVGFDKNLKLEDAHIEHPASAEHGDYSSNIALKLASQEIKGNFLENIEWILRNVKKRNFEEIEPRDGLPVGKLNDKVQKAIRAKSSFVYLKPRIYGKIRGWWKYRAGHPEVIPEILFLPLIINSPVAIYKDGSKKDIFLFTFKIFHHGVLVIEIQGKGVQNEVVTMFFLGERRLKEYEFVLTDKKSFLGRTRISPLLAPQAKLGVAGARFPSLQESYKFYNILKKKCQEDIVNYQIKKSPMEWAEEIRKIFNFQISIFNDIDRVEVAPPGFINFWLSQEFLQNSLVQSIELGEKYGSSKAGEGKTVVIDYSSPNIAKPFGIGHLRSTIIGQALYNLYKFTGWKTIGDNHLGDWGTQFGKLIAAIKKWGGKNLAEMSIKDLEELYVKFHKAAEKEPGLEDEARAWFKKLEDKDSEAKKIWQSCVSLSLKEFDRIYDLLGVKIDYALGESFYEDKMDEVIIEAKTKGITKESRGALIIEIPKIKTPLMLLKSDGATTYHTRDLATIEYRLGKWRPDLYIYEVGAEQKLYFQQLFGAAVLLGYAGVEQFVHIGHGLYRWSGGKLSTREGKTIYLEEVLQEAIQRARKLAQGAGISKELPENLQEKIARAVGIGAVKYNDLKQSPEGDIVFAWDKILSLEGNSGPYLQYTYARAHSVLRKMQRSKDVKTQRFDDLSGSLDLWISGSFNKEEAALLRTIYRFPEIVLAAAKGFAPNLICNFLFDLAQKYNNFYNLHPIIKAPSEELVNLRLALTLATARVLKNGLLLLGIEPLEKM